MTPMPLGLLSLVGSAARTLTGGPQTQAAGAADFASLLEAAQDGSLGSGRAVTLGADVEVSLSEQQLERLAIAADRAEAAGASTAVTLIDGMALVLDVRSRTITGSVDPGGAEPVVGVDTVIAAPPAPQSDAGAPRATLISNPSLLEALSRAHG